MFWEKGWTIRHNRVMIRTGRQRYCRIRFAVRIRCYPWTSTGEMFCLQCLRPIKVNICTESRNEVVCMTNNSEKTYERDDLNGCTILKLINNGKYSWFQFAFANNFNSNKFTVVEIDFVSQNCLLGKWTKTSQKLELNEKKIKQSLRNIISKTKCSRPFNLDKYWFFSYPYLFPIKMYESLCYLYSWRAKVAHRIF